MLYILITRIRQRLAPIFYLLLVSIVYTSCEAPGGGTSDASGKGGGTTETTKPGEAAPAAPTTVIQPSPRTAFPTTIQNSPPVASSGAYSMDEDTSLSILLNASDAEGMPLNFTIVSMPTKGKLTVIDTKGTLKYTPGPNINGNDSFSFKANDEKYESNIASVNIVITPVNDSPLAFDSNITVDGTNFTVGTLSATDTDNDALTYSIVSSPTKGSLILKNPSTGTFQYTPTANTDGVDSFTFKASDSSGVYSNVATVYIDINGINRAPLANAGSFIIDKNVSAIGTLSASDPDNDALTYSIVTAASKGNVSITNTSTGAFEYAPNLEMTGTDSFTFKVSDGKLSSNVATISITINHVNRAPIATNGTLTLNENTSAVATLTASDADNDLLFFSIVGQPSKGSVSITNSATGAYKYVSNAGQSGNDTFTFKVNDGALNSNIATVAINIIPAPAPVPPAPSSNDIELYRATESLDQIKNTGDTLEFGLGVVNDPMPEREILVKNISTKDLIAQFSVSGDYAISFANNDLKTARLDANLAAQTSFIVKVKLKTDSAVGTKAGVLRIAYKNSEIFEINLNAELLAANHVHEAIPVVIHVLAKENIDGTISTSINPASAGVLVNYLNKHSIRNENLNKEICSNTDIADKNCIANQLAKFSLKAIVTTVESKHYNATTSSLHQVGYQRGWIGALNIFIPNAMPSGIAGQAMYLDAYTNKKNEHKSIYLMMGKQYLTANDGNTVTHEMGHLAGFHHTTETWVINFKTMPAYYYEGAYWHRGYPTTLCGFSNYVKYPVIQRGTAEVPGWIIASNHMHYTVSASKSFFTGKFHSAWGDILGCWDKLNRREIR